MGQWLLALGALAFAVVHAPYPALMAATGVMALAFIPLFARYRTVWPLGVYHGWLGTLYYLWVLGRDPWIEVFG